jgi:pyrroloquinoline quinone (PQQ) biosynthesis protein C
MQSLPTSLANSLLAQHPPAAHPLFQLVRDDALDAEELRGLGLDVYHVTAAFPRFLAALAARIEDLQRRAPWVENLYCEQGGANPRSAHVLSYRRFLHELGIDDAAIDGSLPGLAALCYCRALFDLCSQQPVAEAKAALSIVEDIVARISPLLTEYARVRSGNPRAGEHFAMHSELDQDHASMSYRECERDLPGAHALVERGLRLGLHYQWQLYSQLVEQHVVPSKWRAVAPGLGSPALAWRRGAGA